jgi:hypothetical protein
MSGRTDNTKSTKFLNAATQRKPRPWRSSRSWWGLEETSRTAVTPFIYFQF